MSKNEDKSAVNQVKGQIRKVTIAKASPTGKFEFAYFSELRNPNEWAKYVCPCARRVVCRF
jgi:hypothetical protein